MEENVFIKLEHISKTFPGVKALDNISLTIKHGEVHALVGENGAGKSTLIKVLAGNYKPDEGGRIMIDGETFDSLTPRLSLHKGIVVIYQDFSLFPNLSVAENISITEEMEKKGVCVNWNEMRTIAQKALERLGVDIDVNVQLGTLSTAKQQLVAIARALACDAKLIIMDEPTSTLSSGEVELLFKIIRELKRQNISVLFVSHKLEELFEIADMFTVIRDGQYIDARPRDQMDNDTLISLMVGRKVEFVHQGADKLGDVVLEVRHLSRYGNFKDVSFTVRKGEIVSLSGLVGAGRTEVVQAICGLEPADSGEILIHGKPVTIKKSKRLAEQRAQVLKHRCSFRGWASAPHVSPVQSFRYFIARGQHCQARDSSTEAAEKSRACRRFRSRCRPCGAPTPRGIPPRRLYAKKRPHGP